MTNEQAREIFNAAIRDETDADKAARLEVAREFFTNADFRKNLEDFVWQINSAKAR